MYRQQRKSNNNKNGGKCSERHDNVQASSGIITQNPNNQNGCLEWVHRVIFCLIMIA